MRRIVWGCFEDVVVHNWIFSGLESLQTFETPTSGDVGVHLAPATRAGTGAARTGACAGTRTPTATAASPTAGSRFGRGICSAGDSFSEGVDIAHDF